MKPGGEAMMSLAADKIKTLENRRYIDNRLLLTP